MPLHYLRVDCLFYKQRSIKIWARKKNLTNQFCSEPLVAVPSLTQPAGQPLNTTIPRQQTLPCISLVQPTRQRDEDRYKWRNVKYSSKTGRSLFRKRCLLNEIIKFTFLLVLQFRAN